MSKTVTLQVADNLQYRIEFFYETQSQRLKCRVDAEFLRPHGRGAMQSERNTVLSGYDLVRDVAFWIYSDFHSHIAEFTDPVRGLHIRAVESFVDSIYDMALSRLIADSEALS